jgi:uncharacterized protein
MATRAKKAPGGKGGGPTSLWTGDSFENLMTGLGGVTDKMTGMTFRVTEMTRPEQDAAYRGDWIARKVVDCPAKDATREWRSWQADKDDITKIEALEDKLALQRKVFIGLQMARLYGGAALILGAETGSMEQELVPERVKKDGLKFVHVVSRHDISAHGQMNWDLTSPLYGQPEFWTRTQGGMEKLHPSRVVRLLGNQAFDPAIINTGWGDSSLQVVKDAVFAAGAVMSSTAQAVQEMKIDIVRTPGLVEQIGSKDYLDRLTKRFGAASTMKGVFHMLLLDKEEEWERIEQTFTGLPDVLKMYLLIASGAADIPATRLLGQSPAGLSATGESDMRNYYDSIKAEQNSVLRPALETLDRIVQMASLGKINEDIHYEWDPLWQMDDKQRAEVAKSKADTFKADNDAGLIPPEVLRDARINQLIEDGTYPGLEQILEEFGPLEDIEEEIVDPTTGLPIDPNAPPADPNSPPAAPKGLQPVQGAEKPAAPTPKKKGPPRAADAINARVRDARVDDLQPRTLYVRRDVLNKRALSEWASSQGLTLIDDPHVTLLYSRKPVDWNKAGEAWGQDEAGRLRVAPGGMRVIEKLGAKSIALCFASSQLCYRHHDLLRALDTTWDYDSYQPHVTITEADNVDVTKIEPFTGELLFGPEVFEPTK